MPARATELPAAALVNGRICGRHHEHCQQHRDIKPQCSRLPPKHDATTFLRGVQLTNRDGIVEFSTVHPGCTPAAIFTFICEHINQRAVFAPTREKAFRRRNTPLVCPLISAPLRPSCLTARTSSSAASQWRLRRQVTKSFETFRVPVRANSAGC